MLTMFLLHTGHASLLCLRQLETANYIILMSNASAEEVM